MSKITINNMNFNYTEYFQPIFTNINLSIDTDWKLGLIGRNGRGKSTLLKLINGDLEPDSGTISKSVNTEYFPYTHHVDYIKTMDVIKENIGGLKTMEDTMDDIINNNDEKRFDEYQQVLEKYVELDGYNVESKIKREFNLMGLSENILEQDYTTLSGGEKTKTQIISLFLRQNAFVLLDEPTNHLDIDGRDAISNYLENKSGFILVSHDVSLLDDTVDHIISINKSNITVEKGNYSTWLSNKESSELHDFRTKTNLEREIRQLERDSSNKRQWGAVANTKKAEFRTFRGGRSNDSRAQKFMRQAKCSEKRIQDNINEKKQLLKNYETVDDLAISQKRPENEIYVIIHKLNFNYPNKNIFNDFSLQIGHGDIIWLRGKNGAGKSTLLRLITGEIKVEDEDSVRLQENLRISQSYQESEWKEGLLTELIEKNSEIDINFRDKFNDICDCLDIRIENFDKPIETYSSGEKRKIDIARALATDNDLLLLDEPLNYMDSYFKEQLKKAIMEYQPTVIFIEHDESFGRSIANKIITLKSDDNKSDDDSLSDYWRE